MTKPTRRIRRQPIPVIPVSPEASSTALVDGAGLPSPASPTPDGDASGISLDCDGIHYDLADDDERHNHYLCTRCYPTPSWRPARDVDGLVPAFRPGPSMVVPARRIGGGK